MNISKQLVCALVFLSGDCWAGPYISGMLYYDDDPIMIEGVEASNKRFDFAVGYKKHFNDNFRAKVEINHNSDPENTGKRDLISDEIIGVGLEYEWGR